MTHALLSLAADGGTAHKAHRASYLARLVAPMDDMWNAFADQASQHALREGGEAIGSCAVDGEKRLLRFYVTEERSSRSGELLRLVQQELGVEQVMVGTLDPYALGPALDRAESVSSHSLFYTHVSEPEVAGLAGITVAPPEALERVIAFEEETIKAPREFLEFYVGERLARHELFVHEVDGEIQAIGELRREPIQPGVAQVGMIVHPRARRQGLASGMLAQLVALARAESLHPICSTELSNEGARRAIERAGFRAYHRWLAIRPTN